ncbi:MAG: ribonuclease HIII, partial [Ignavibacteriales bacterium]
MDIKEKSALNILERYKIILNEIELEVSAPSKNEFSYQVFISDGKDKISLLVFFGKKGNKIVLQGNKDLKLYKRINELIFGEKLFSSETSEHEPQYPYIGTDESGKGDYFGPLVFAGVFITPESGQILKSIGVKDSKELGDNRIIELASEIKKIVQNKYDVVFISPEKYNQMWSKMGNLNRIMGWGHARVLENILNKCDADEAISDKFGNEKIILDALQEKGRTINLKQITKAEKYSAVAAASILARESVINWFSIASKKLKIKIPKGSSSEVERTAKIILEKHGTEELNKLVKLHFKSSKKVFNKKGS